MKNFKTMVIITASVAVLTACKKEKETELATPEIQTTASASEFSDIHLCTERYPQGVSPRAASVKTRQWTNGSKIKVSFFGGTSYVRNKVIKYASEWENYANIDFQFVNNYDPTATIRVTFEDDGSWSYIGKQALSIPSSKATMNFGWFDNYTSDVDFRSTTLHEFGHALGLIHEHQHPLVTIPWDKPKVYAYYAGAPNYWSREDVDFNLFTKYSTGQTNYSAYDRLSIMHYYVPEQLTIGTYSVGDNIVLSSTDKTFIASIYPR